MRKATRRWAALSAAVAAGVMGTGGPLAAAPATFDGDAAVGIAGDNVTWGSANNWTTNGVVDTLPTDTAPGDDLTFGGGTAGGVIDLGAARVANSLSFNRNYTLGLAATALVLTDTSGNATVNTGTTGTINAVLAGANGINLSGGGTLLLNRATGNTFTGNITVTGAGTTLAYLGTNSSADPTALGAAGARTITLTNGGAISVAGGTLSNPTATTKSFVIGTGGGRVDTASGQTLQLDDAGQFGGTADLTKTGAGTLVLDNQPFNFTGAVNISAGTVRLARNAGLLGTAAATVAPITVASGATFNIEITQTSQRPITISGTGVGNGGALVDNSTTPATVQGVTLAADASVGGSGNLTIAGVVSGGFNLTKVGGGATILTGANTYTGNTTVSGGAVRATFGTGLPATTNLVLNGGALEPTANFAGTLGTGAGQVQLPGGASGFSAGVAGTITVNLNGGAALQWGSATFNPSALVLNQPTALGTVDLQNPIDLNGAARTFGGNGPLANPGVVSGPITSTGGPVDVTINGTGVVQFANAGNTGIASLTLTNGELGYSSDANIGGANTPITFNGGILQVIGTGITTFPAARPVTYTASRAIGFDVAAAGHTLTVNSSFPTTTTTFTKNGPGTLALTAASNTFVTLQANGGTLDLTNGAYTLANGGGNIIQSTGGGTINATGGGTLTLSSASATDGGNVGTANGTTLTINAPIVSTGSATGAFEIFSANNGTGVVALTANNTFTGDVFINSNVLSVPAIGNGGAAGPLGQGTTIHIGNSTTTTGTLRYTGTGETNNRVINLRGTTAGATVEMAGTGTLVFTANVTATGAGSKTLNLIGSTAGVGELAGVIPNNSGTNTTAVTKNGTGTWRLSGVNTFTGTVNVNQGNLIITNSAALGTGTKTIDLDNGTAGTPQLMLDGSGGDITLPATFTYITSVNTSATVGAFVNVAGNNTIQGVINPKDGGGDTGVVVQGGSLTIAANVNTAATGLGTRSLRLRGPGTGTLSGTITNGSSTVGIVQEGPGTWAITGNGNTYSGATTVSGGTLLANNTSGSATGTSAVTVSGSGTLGGSGIISGAVTVNPGGSINPGNSPGTLSIASPVTFGNTGTGAAPTYVAELTATGTPVAGTTNDLLALTGSGAAGALTLTNPDRLALVALTPITTQTTYTIATFASQTGVFDTVLVNSLPTQSTDPGQPNYALVTYNPTNIQVTVNNLAAVPEPASAGLLGLAAVGLLARRRRARRVASSAMHLR